MIVDAVAGELDRVHERIAGRRETGPRPAPVRQQRAREFTYDERPATGQITRGCTER
jgi:hypothetical protein